MAIIQTIHIISASLFLLLLLTKTVLLLANKKESLEKLKNKTKVPDMVNSSIFLLTGIYMLVQIGMGNIGGWFHLKLTLIVIVIALGIVAFKRNSKVLAAIASFLVLYIYGISETKDARFGIGKKKVENVITDVQAEGYDRLLHGESIYLSQCQRCHGEDGKMGISGATDLTASKLTTDSITGIVTTGKKAMPAFQSLTEDELHAVSAYAASLQKN